MAKAMTPAELYLIDAVLFRDIWETGPPVDEDDYSSIYAGDGSHYEQLEKEEYCPRGELEQAESWFRGMNFVYRSDAISVEGGSLTVKPHPHFDSWQEFFTSLLLSGEVIQDRGGI